uniref:(northern house mosquito) hypothetical protein n=1 Tax=Culex pipiens TaxID=7175 RepID=A0A8D8CL71_CULPI
MSARGVVSCSDSSRSPCARSYRTGSLSCPSGDRPRRGPISGGSTECAAPPACSRSPTGGTWSRSTALGFPSCPCPGTWSRRSAANARSRFAPVRCFRNRSAWSLA